MLRLGVLAAVSLLGSTMVLASPGDTSTCDGIDSPIEHARCELKQDQFQNGGTYIQPDWSFIERSDKAPNGEAYIVTGIADSYTTEAPDSEPPTIIVTCIAGGATVMLSPKTAISTPGYEAEVRFGDEPAYKLFFSADENLVLHVSDETELKRFIRRMATFDRLALTFRVGFFKDITFSLRPAREALLATAAACKLR